MNKELAELYRQDRSNAVQKIYSRILRLPFKAPEIRAINACVGRELLLRDTARDPEPAKISSDQ